MFNPALLNETLCTFQQAASQMAPRPHYKTLRQWISEKRTTDRCPQGTTLEWCHGWAGKMTSREAVARFEARLNGQQAPPPKVPPSPLYVPPCILRYLDKMASDLEGQSQSQREYQERMIEAIATMRRLVEKAQTEEEP